MEIVSLKDFLLDKPTLLQMVIQQSIYKKNLETKKKIDQKQSYLQK